jgi:hypothetical protein
LGWQWVGRLRHRTLVSPVEDPGTPNQWLACKLLYALATDTPRALGLMDMVRNHPMRARIVTLKKPPVGRMHSTLKGQRRRGQLSRQNARREREPWLIVASPSLQLSARQLVTLYSRRMQIELSFRDLKSHRYGQGFEDSLTRSPERLQVLLLIHMLATFAAGLAGRACERAGLDAWLSPRRSKRRLYSLVRLGREAMVRNWPTGTLRERMQTLHAPPDELRDQMGVPS